MCRVMSLAWAGTICHALLRRGRIIGVLLEIMSAMDKGIQKNKVVSLNIPILTDGAHGVDVSHTSSRVSSLDRWIARKLLNQIGHPPIALVLWNGEEISSSPATPDARVHIRDSEVLRS